MQTATAPVTAVMPCHGVAAMSDTTDLAAADLAAADIDLDDLAAADSTSSEHNACSMCDLCHGTVADAPRALWLPAAPPAIAPLPGAPTLLEPAVQSGPERPPRPTTL